MAVQGLPWPRLALAAGGHAGGSQVLLGTDDSPVRVPSLLPGFVPHPGDAELRGGYRTTHPICRRPCCRGWKWTKSGCLSGANGIRWRWPQARRCASCRDISWPAGTIWCAASTTWAAPVCYSVQMNTVFVRARTQWMNKIELSYRL